MTADYASERARILVGDARDRLKDLPENSVHTVVTSPPYWGLRDYGVEGQIGLEESIGEHIQILVDVFEDVRRVLRPDGTLWLNYGDRYVTSPPGPGGSHTSRLTNPERQNGLKDHYQGTEDAGHDLERKNLIGMPWRVAFALQEAGWILRQEVIWHKKNPMPESVTDRPTRQHEQLFLFTLNQHYFYDAHAIRVPKSENTHSRGKNRPPKVGDEESNVRNKQSFHENTAEVVDTRNKRSVWTLTGQPFPDAHFAVFPPKLVRPCVRAGTSEAGCCADCGAPIERVVDRKPQGDWNPRDKDQAGLVNNGSNGLASDFHEEYEPPETEGWEQNCDCDTDDTTPPLVLDPFLGAGTTSLVALEEGCHAVGVELSPDYADMAWERIRDLAETPRLDRFAKEVAAE